MRLGDPKIWLSGFSAAGAVLVVVSSASRGHSPGELAEVHQRIDGLAENCAACHGEGDQELADACIECHVEVGEHIASGRGLHGTLEQPLACALCHSDHHGADFPLTHARSFAAAGVSDLHEFDHGILGWTLDGAHVGLDCQDCHSNAWESVLPEGGQRYLGLDQNCASCHEDPHDEPLLRDCASCHDQGDFHTFEHFEHDPPLTGSHAQLSCHDCHAPESAHSILRSGARFAAPTARACAECHEDPHDESFVASLAVGLAPAAVCADCHSAEHEGFSEPEELTAWQHAASGFLLEDPHDQAACADCHNPFLETFAERYPGRMAQDCASCHDDPHEEQFGQTSCLSCHLPHQFEEHLFDLDRHGKTQFPLDGAHAKAACEACHEPATPTIFAGLPATCSSCHDDVHHGVFDGAPQGCAACHGTSSFAEEQASFDHGEWTGFALRGAHLHAACAACHADEPASGLGAVSCADCHSDPHEGHFEASCNACHEETSWRSMPRGFDHGAHTGFVLEGAHADARCSACHAPTPTGSLGRSLGFAAGTHCSDCHSDPHAGQFERSCHECHAGAHRFSDLVFDHGRDASFVLDEAHSGLECSACHRPSGDSGVVHYKPLGQRCVDCHGTNPGQGGGK